jgi:DNA mismatch repair protein MutS2
MARAGLHLPTDLNANASVPWTSRVLADLGDAQSLDLEGGLSTFSAHLTRLRRILAAALDTNDSVVVLLDEPGGGTDPAEGAALAAAVLRASARRAALTVATSHYEEVKALAGGIRRNDDGPDAESPVSKAVEPFPGAANAAVEFDTLTLRPTYRLLWGASGESNALAVARGLGLETDLADAAERRWRRGRATNGVDPLSDLGVGEDLAELASALTLERETQETRASAAAEALERARDLHADVLLRGAALLALRTSLAVDAADARGTAGVTEAHRALSFVSTRDELDSVVDSLMPDGWIIDARTGDAAPGRRRRRKKDPEDLRSRDEDGVSFDSGDGVDEPTWIPRVGSRVTVRRMGDAEAEVVAVDANSGEVVVRMGSITSRAPLTGVAPLGGKE